MEVSQYQFQKALDGMSEAMNGQGETNKKGVGMCMNVAPGRIAVCEKPPTDRSHYLTPWCHLPKGHEGHHVCGEHCWESDSEGKVKP